MNPFSILLHTQLSTRPNDGGPHHIKEEAPLCPMGQSRQALFLDEHLGVQGELHGRGELRCGVFGAGNKPPAFSHLTHPWQVIPDLLPHSLGHSLSSEELWDWDDSFHSQGGAGWSSTLARSREDVFSEQSRCHCLLSKVWLCQGGVVQDWSPLWLCPLGRSSTLLHFCLESHKV